MELAHRLYAVTAIVGFLSCVATLLVSRTGTGGQVGAQLAALRSPVGAANVGSAVIGLAIGAWVEAIAMGLVGVTALQGSLPVGTHRRHDMPPSPHVTLSTANVLVHNDRFRELAQRLLDSTDDILLLQEVTPAHARALEELVRPRIDCHLVAEPRDDYAGWATLSRHPVRSQGRIDLPSWPISWVVVDHPVMPVRVVNVHVAAPHATHDQATWELQLSRLTDFADRSFPTVLAGDFNATADHRPFRRLLHAGFTDAFDHAGRGWGATWPAHRFAFPLLRLDHVLVDRTMTVTRIDSIELVGSDHRGLRAVLRPVPDDTRP